MIGQSIINVKSGGVPVYLHLVQGLSVNYGGVYQ